MILPCQVWHQHHPQSNTTTDSLVRDVGVLCCASNMLAGRGEANVLLPHLHQSHSFFPPNFKLVVFSRH